MVPFQQEAHKQGLQDTISPLNSRIKCPIGFQELHNRRFHNKFSSYPTSKMLPIRNHISFQCRFRSPCFKAWCLCVQSLFNAYKRLPWLHVLALLLPLLLKGIFSSSTHEKECLNSCIRAPGRQTPYRQRNHRARLCFNVDKYSEFWSTWWVDRSLSCVLSFF